MNTDTKKYGIALLVLILILGGLWISGKAEAIGEPNSNSMSCQEKKEEIRDFIYESQMHLAYFSTFTLVTNPDPSLQKSRIKGFVNWKRLISQENSFNCQEYLELVYAMEESMDLALYLTLIGSTKSLFDATEQLALEETYTGLGNQLIYFMTIVVDKLTYFGVEAKDSPSLSPTPIPNS